MSDCNGVGLRPSSAAPYLPASVEAGDDTRSRGPQPTMDEMADAELDPPVPEGGLVRILPIVNRRGLHARASARFVQTVERFDAAVTVTRAGETVGGRSIMGLLTLGAAQGTSIAVVAVGDDAQAALAAIETLLAERFGEDE